MNVIAGLVVILAAGLAPRVASHGMLWWPVNRGSMWRFGYATPVNYDDNAQFCGGAWMQWGENNGSCGECGDDFSLARPRPNENTGKFGTGVTVARYPAGAAVDVSVLITANHRGYFQLRLCPLSHALQLETQECFDRYPLRVRDPPGALRYALPGDLEGFYNYTVLLPPGLACHLCVLQWTYVTGNSWGTCANGSSAVGCGQQEYFRTCSDISIY